MHLVSFLHISYAQCPSCLANSTQAWLPDITDMEILPHLPVAFHCKLLKGVEVHRKSLVEVANFQTVCEAVVAHACKVLSNTMVYGELYTMRASHGKGWLCNI